MKQKRVLFICISLSLFAAILFPGTATSQTLMKQSFDTSGYVIMSSTPYKGWTDSVYTKGYGCCAPEYNWIWGLEPGTYNSRTYTAWPKSSYSYWYPNAPTHSGSGYAILNTLYMYYGGYISYAPASVEMRSPAVALPSTGKSVVSYWVFLDYSYYGNYNYYWDSLQVWVNTDPRSYGTNAYKLRKLVVDSLTSSSYNGWVHYSDTIPSSFNGQTVYAMFKGFNAYYYFGTDILIDDVSIDHYFQCAGMPDAGIISGPSHICRTKQFTLTDTGGTSYVGMSYQWQSRPTGTTAWTDISSSSGGTTNPLVTSIPLGSDNTDYRVYMTCDASGFVDTSDPWTVTADSFFRCYCAIPTTNVAIGGKTPPIIDSVAIQGTTLKNATHKAFDDGYGQIADSVQQTKAVMSKGGKYTITVKYSGATCYGMAWIDWNRDGLESSSEYISLNTSLKDNATVSFTVPTTASTGRTGLRIRATTAYFPSSTYACQNFGTGTGAGETVDYIVTITDPPSIDLGVTAITTPPAGATYCPNKPDTIIASVLNYGNASISNFYVYAITSGPAPDTIYTYYTGSLASLASANVLIGTIDPPLGGSYSLRVFTSKTSDAVPYNDTSFSYFNLYDLPGAPVVQSDTVCPGGMATISVTPLPGEQYKWYRSMTTNQAFDSSSKTMSFMPVGDSVYYVSATNTTTKCVGNRVPITAAVRPQPVVDLGPDSTLCESPTFFLDAGNPGGSKYTWNTGDTVRKINPRASGTYTVTVDHYCTTTDSVHLVIDPLPTAGGINFIRTDNTYAFSVAGAMYTLKYKWFFGDGNTDTVAAPIHTYSTSGSYHVQVVLYNDCGTDTVNWGVPNKVKNVGTQNGVVNLYPNPANNILTVEGGDNTMLKQVIIVNTVGSIVYSRDINNEKKVDIDVSSLPQGQYILRVNTNLGISSKLFDILHRQ